MVTNMTFAEILIFALLLFAAFCGGIWFHATMTGRAPKDDAPSPPEKTLTAEEIAAEEARLLAEREKQWQNMMAYNGDSQTE